MPYTLVPLVAALALGIRFVILADASLRSRLIVAALVVISVAIGWYHPEWMLAATLLQVGVSIFVLLYLRLHPHAS